MSLSRFGMAQTAWLRCLCLYRIVRASSSDGLCAYLHIPDTPVHAGFCTCREHCGVRKRKWIGWIMESLWGQASVGQEHTAHWVSTPKLPVEISLYSQSDKIKKPQLFLKTRSGLVSRKTALVITATQLSRNRSHNGSAAKIGRTFPKELKNNGSDLQVWKSNTHKEH